MSVQLSFGTKVLDDNGLFTQAWQIALKTLAGAAFSESWQYWRPDVSAVNGGMIVTNVTINNAQYVRSNSVCLVNFYITFTTVSGTGRPIYVTLPVPYRGVQTSVPVDGWGSNGVAETIPLVAILNPGVPLYLQVFAGGNDSDNWTLGLHYITGTFAYNCE